MDLTRIRNINPYIQTNQPIKKKTLCRLLINNIHYTKCLYKESIKSGTVLQTIIRCDIKHVIFILTLFQHSLEINLLIYFYTH